MPTSPATCKRRLRSMCLTAAEQIASECGGDTDAPVAGGTAVISGCGEALVELLRRQAGVLAGLNQGREEERRGGERGGSSGGADGEEEAEEEEEDDALLRRRSALLAKRLDDLISLSYSRFYAYLYKDLPLCWRLLYTDASILKFGLLYLLLPAGREQHEEQGPRGVYVEGRSLDDLIKPLDLAIILAGAAGESRGREWIDEALGLLDGAYGLGNPPAGPSSISPVKCGGEPAGEAVMDSPPLKKLKLSDASEPPQPSGGEAAPTVDWSQHPSFSSLEPFTPPVKNPIRRVSTAEMPMMPFQSYMDRPRNPALGPEPLVITGITDDWPARTIRPWGKPTYLLSRTSGGRRLVPVEVGRSYVDEGWGQKIVRFGEFLKDYVDASVRTQAMAAGGGGGGDDDGAVAETKDKKKEEEKNKATPTAYLAQHQLFNQLPSLRGDIRIPDYCYTVPPPPPQAANFPQPAAELEEPLLNAWLGPPGTITPLHTDPYHNMLAQLVGRKYVRLYSPLHTAHMSARGVEDGVQMGNTSALDVGVLEGWDGDAGGDDGHQVDDDVHDDADDDDDIDGYQKKEDEADGRAKTAPAAAAAAAAERFRDVPFVDCILGPGDTLYIPVGWWHYVRGLSVSFSVSFWWN